MAATVGCSAASNSGPDTAGTENGNSGNANAAPSADAPANPNLGGGLEASVAVSIDAGEPIASQVLGDAEAVVDSPALEIDAATVVEAGNDANAAEGSLGDSGETSGCDGKMAMGSEATGPAATPTSGYGTIEFNVSTQNQIVALKTTLTVPGEPPPEGTLFLWPGLQPLPGGQNYYPIGNGVLQPVLTWGGTCAPSAPNDYSSWWISGQYVNPSGPPGHTGCMGGNGTTVTVGDQLDISMTLNATSWNQVIVDRQTGLTATYDIDMAGQAQNWGIFTIEMPDGLKPVSDVVFSSTTLTFAGPDEVDCQPSVRGQYDYFSAPQSSTDGKSCCVSKMILRAAGVAATTSNGP